MPNWTCHVENHETLALTAPHRLQAVEACESLLSGPATTLGPLAACRAACLDGQRPPWQSAAESENASHLGSRSSMALRCAAVPAGLWACRYCLSSARVRRLARSDSLDAAESRGSLCSAANSALQCAQQRQGARPVTNLARSRYVDSSASHAAHKLVHERYGRRVFVLCLSIRSLLCVQAFCGQPPACSWVLLLSSARLQKSASLTKPYRTRHLVRWLLLRGHRLW